MVTADGILGIARGATPAAVAKAWNTRLSLVGTPGTGCTIAAVRIGKATGYALFRHGRLAAVFFEAGARTDRGVTIGSKAARLAAAYPGIAARGGSYFAAPLRFDVDGRGTVIRIGYGDVRSTSCL